MLRPSAVSRLRSISAGVAVILLTLPTHAFAETPWERAVRVLAESVTGPIARGLTLVAIVVGGIGYAFDGPDNKRTLAGLILGGGMALGAASLVAWLFL